MGKGLQLYCTQHQHLVSMMFQTFSTNFLTCGAPYSSSIRNSSTREQLFLTWIGAPNLTFQQPVHLHNRRLRLGCAGLQHRQSVQFLLCPAFRRPSAVLSFALLEIFSCPSSFPHNQGVIMLGFFVCLSEGAFFIFSSLQGCWSFF